MAVLFCDFMLERQQISELLAPFCEGQELAAEQVEYLYIYLNLLLKWNRVINLTAIRQPEQIVHRHFGESLFAARHLLAPGAAGSVIDIGSGAGFPGMVLKIFAPAIGLTLVEANGKKATFLRELARSLHFTDVRVAQERAERLSEKASLVTFRAVEKFESILLTAASLMSPGGRLGALIGAGQLATAASSLPGQWSSVAVPESEARVLAIFRPNAH